MVTRAGIPSPIVRPAFVKSKPLPHHQTTTMQPSHPIEAPLGVANGKVFIWKEKMHAYVQSGYGAHGVLAMSYDQRQVQCHQCGTWRELISQRHLNGCSPGLTLRDYKMKHGLKLGTPLCGTIYSETMRAHAIRRGFSATRQPHSLVAAMEARRKIIGVSRLPNYEQANFDDECLEQNRVAFHSIEAKLGRTPSVSEFSDFRGKTRGVLLGALQGYGMTYNQFVEFCGATPNVRGSRSEWSKPMAEERTMEYYRRTGRVPTFSLLHSYRRRAFGLPGVHSVMYLYGSFEKYMAASNLEVVWREQVAASRRVNAAKARAAKESCAAD